MVWTSIDCRQEIRAVHGRHPPRLHLASPNGSTRFRSGTGHAFFKKDLGQQEKHFVFFLLTQISPNASESGSLSVESEATKVEGQPSALRLHASRSSRNEREVREYDNGYDERR
jgi:hypothetical protein